MGEREREDALLDMGGELVRHPGRPPLPGTKSLQAPGEDLPLPAVVGGVVDPHRTACCSDVAELSGKGKQPHPLTVNDIIECQAAPPSVTTARSKRRMRRLSLDVWEPRPNVSGELGVSSG